VSTLLRLATTAAYPAPPESPTLGLSHLPFEAIRTAARTSTNPFDFTLVTMHPRCVHGSGTCHPDVPNLVRCGLGIAEAGPFRARGSCRVGDVAAVWIALGVLGGAF
jgi:hypothetical protein